MSNWNDTELKCSNPEVVKACATALAGMDENGTRHWKDGDTDIRVHTRNDIPDDKVKEISKQFPGDVITCRYSFEYDFYSQVFTVEYRNGEGKEVNIEPGYMFGHIPLNNDNDRDAIYKKTIAFYRRLDTTETDKDGKFSLNWFDEEVCYKFEHDGADGKKYRIEATKGRSHIDFKVFEGHVKYDWQEIPNNTGGGDVPF